MKKGKLWTALLLTMTMCINPFLTGLPGTFFHDSYVNAEENEEADTGGDDSQETEIDPTVQTNDIPGWPQGDPVECDAAICMDGNTGTVLYGKNIDKQEYPASITKIMTVLLALENGNLDDTVTFSENAVYSIEYGSAHLGLTAGEKLTLEQCLYGIMLASANEISNAVAEHIGGSIENFADMMNKKAEELGCVNTHFVNPNGLHDDNHYTCAYDMALITQAAMKYDKFREIIHTQEYSYPETNLVKEKRYFVNHHGMLTDESRAYDGFIGGKTGYTDEAWNTLVSTAQRDGVLLISVVLHADGQDIEYGNTKTVLDYGFDNFKEVQVNNQDLALAVPEVTGIDDPQEVEKIKTADLSQEPFSMEETTIVTIPDSADVSSLTRKMDFTTNTLTYYYGGQAVGSTSFTYTGEWEAETETETASETETESETEAGGFGKMIQNSAFADNKVVTTIIGGYDKVDLFIKTHTVLAVILGAVLLIIFIPLLLVSISRNKKYKRMIELRTQEMALRRQLEAEIEQKSAAQVEAELRAQELEIQLEEERKKNLRMQQEQTGMPDSEGDGENQPEESEEDMTSGETKE